jgi:hypothetical protein
LPDAFAIPDTFPEPINKYLKFIFWVKNSIFENPSQ